MTVENVPAARHPSAGAVCSGRILELPLEDVAPGACRATPRVNPAGRQPFLSAAHGVQVGRSSQAVASATYSHCEAYWRATGAREQLIELGLCAASHFPAGRRRWNLGDDGDHRWSIERESDGRWALTIWRSTEERGAERRRRRAQDRAKSRLAGLASSAHVFREDLSGMVTGWCSAISGEQVGSDPSGFELSPHAQNEIRALCARIQLVVRNAEVRLHEGKRQQFIKDLELEVECDDVMPSLAAAAHLSAVPREGV